MKDIKNHIDAVNSIDPDDYTATINGLGIDLRGFEGSAVVFSVGTVTDGTHNPARFSGWNRCQHLCLW